MKLHEYLALPNVRASELARSLGVSSAVVYQWRVKKRPVPLEYCASIERATDGAVTRRDLRPDDWQEIWPEIAQPPTTTEAAHE
ncbi:MAG: hypothetical protein CML17_06330 [Pusillimonas sp.]|jgi:DNA-binding transcriptional regulator YdaS (Cro superfamily)|nr:hypothetical protein [Pusillimonas sp.]